MRYVLELLCDDGSWFAIDAEAGTPAPVAARAMRLRNAAIIRGSQTRVVAWSIAAELAAA